MQAGTVSLSVQWCLFMEDFRGRGSSPSYLALPPLIRIVKGVVGATSPGNRHCCFSTVCSRSIPFANEEGVKALHVSADMMQEGRFGLYLSRKIDSPFASSV